ncbi:MAG TPA: hypothetical protein VNG11_02450 [Chloroflexota bacterium]|nr:hypothetical protein [Chloroflexota bacterium]
MITGETSVQHLARALILWQNAAGPYWPFVNAAPFVSGHVAGPLLEGRPWVPRWLSEAVDSFPPLRGTPGGIGVQEGVQPGECRDEARPAPTGPLAGPFTSAADPDCSSSAVCSAFNGERAAFFVDVSPTRVLPAAPWLNRRGFVVVPVIQRWSVAPAVLRSERLLAQLVGYATRVERPVGERGVIFILDGDRAGRSSVTASPRRFDNRYEYPPCRFPAPDFLVTQGIRDVCWLFIGSFADDLKPYREALARQGIRSVEQAICVD